MFTCVAWAAWLLPQLSTRTLRRRALLSEIKSAPSVTYLTIVQELCESRGGRPGLSVLTSLLVSVDVKNYLNRASALVTTCP